MIINEKALDLKVGDVVEVNVLENSHYDFIGGPIIVPVDTWPPATYNGINGHDSIIVTYRDNTRGVVLNAHWRKRP